MGSEIFVFYSIPTVPGFWATECDRTGWDQLFFFTFLPISRYLNTYFSSLAGQILNSDIFWKFFPLKNLTEKSHSTKILKTKRTTLGRDRQKQMVTPFLFFIELLLRVWTL